MRRIITPLIERKLLGPLLGVLGGVICFGLALTPFYTLNDNLGGYVPYGKLEQTGSTNYIWTTPDLHLGYADLPRFAPLALKIETSFERPGGTPPAHIDIYEKRGKASLPLLSLDSPPDSQGFQQVLLNIPATEYSSDSLSIDLKASSFKVAGDVRQLGVRIKSISLTVSKAGLVKAVLKQPFFVAMLLLLAGMAAWCWLVGFGPLETCLILMPAGFMAGALANILLYVSWWLVFDALLLIFTAWLWHNRGRQWLKAGYGWRPLALLMCAIGAFAGFYVLAPGLPGDIYYFREVLSPILKYGPIGVYPDAPRLNYPPGSVYQLYFYGIFAQLFNFQFHQSALKLLMGSALLFIPGLMWWAGAASSIDRLHLVRTVMLFGLSIAMLFVPAVWVQADGWLLVLMLAPVLLAIKGYRMASATTQAIAIIYKAQSWLLLPLYGLLFQQRFGWPRSIRAALLTLGLVLSLGGLGFAFDPAVFKVFWNQPAVSGESDWGGIRSFNLMNLLGYDQARVPQPLLALSYAGIGLFYLVVLLVSWQRSTAIARDTSKDRTALADSNAAEWLLAAAVILCFIFFFWIKMHERYLYFGLGFLIVAALYRRDLYRPALLLNLCFTLNLLYAYLPERRDPIPHNPYFWRHFLHAVTVQQALSIGGMLVCIWIGWLYLRPVSLVPQVPWFSSRRTRSGPEPDVLQPAPEPGENRAGAFK